MTRFVKAIREHRDMARTRRALNAAIDSAASPSMRDELLMNAQRVNARES